jgi:hypothetical protein
VGGEFRLNGTLISGLGTPGNSVPSAVPSGSVLSGTLADGTPFALYARDDNIVLGLTLRAATLPVIGPALITASAGSIPLGIREGQTLVVDSGASVPNNFNAGRGSTVNVQPGGTVGANLEAVSAVVNVAGGTTSNMKVLQNATLNVTGGSVWSVSADRTSAVNISGGSMNFLDVFAASILTLTAGSLTGLNAQSGGIVNMSGGSVGNTFRALGGSNVSVSGGTIGTDFTCNAASTVGISGGTIGDRFVATASSGVSISGGSFGDAFKNGAGSAMRLLGGEFRINGAIVTGLDVAGSTKVVSLGASDVLSGVFANGTPFAFASADGDTMTSATLVSASLPPVGSSSVDLPGSPAPPGIRDGQTLNVLNGGQVGDNFNAGWGSALHLSPGGRIGKNLEALGTVEVLGGSIGGNFDAMSGSTVTILGGSIGSSFQALAGSTVNLFGTDFLLNGSPISGLNPGEPFLFTTRTGILSGHFADGTTFTFPLEGNARAGIPQLIAKDARLTLMLVPEPASLWLCVGAGTWAAVGRRRRLLRCGRRNDLKRANRVRSR